MHAFSHITGGGLAANLARVIPDGLHAIVDRSTWTPAPVFDLVGKAGQVERLELEKTLNMGVGMIAIVPEESADVALATLADRGRGRLGRGRDHRPRRAQPRARR